MPDARAPRLNPLPPGEWDDLLRLVVEDSPGGVAQPPNVFTTLGRNPELFRAFIGFGAALRNGRLAARERELLILRTAHNEGSVYEWTHHVSAAAAAGLTAEEIERLRGAADDPAWSADDRALVAAADELHASASLADETWSALAARYDEPELIELIMLVGEYRLLAMALGALRIQLEAAEP